MTTQSTSSTFCSETWAAIAAHEARFERFVGAYLQSHPHPMLRLKREHSLNVLAHARTIVQAEGIQGEAGRAALLAALYHDTGRFPQFVRWKTFSDAQSTNHGTLGVRVVKKEGFLLDEPSRLQHLTLAGIALHNRYRLPKNFSGTAALVTQVTRDADKLDIMRIMAKCLNDPIPADDIVLHVLDEPEQWSPHIVQTVLAGRVPGYSDLRYINDFRMLLATWLQDLFFAGSRRELACSGQVEQVLAGLPQVRELEPVRAYLAEQVRKARESRAI
ncbi:MAG: HD domain-containing protein [Bilophila sp.]